MKTYIKYSGFYISDSGEDTQESYEIIKEYSSELLKTLIDSLINKIYLLVPRNSKDYWMTIEKIEIVNEDQFNS